MPLSIDQKARCCIRSPKPCLERPRKTQDVFFYSQIRQNRGRFCRSGKISETSWMPTCTSRIPPAAQHLTFALAGDDELFAPKGPYGGDLPSRLHFDAPSAAGLISTPTPVYIQDPVKGQMEHLAAMLQDLQRQTQAAQFEVCLFSHRICRSER